MDKNKLFNRKRTLCVFKQIHTYNVRGATVEREILIYLSLSKLVHINSIRCYHKKNKKGPMRWKKKC